MGCLFPSNPLIYNFTSIYIYNTRTTDQLVSKCRSHFALSVHAEKSVVSDALAQQLVPSDLRNHSPMVVLLVLTVWHLMPQSFTNHHWHAVQFINLRGFSLSCTMHINLNFAVHQALNSITATNHFQSFLKSLYALYSQSTRNQPKLREVAVGIGLYLVRTTANFGIRGVAPSFTVVCAVWWNFSALQAHFPYSPLDSTTSFTQWAKL